MKEKAQNKKYKYIYCIINERIKNNFGNIGINENRVYSIPYKEFSIILDNCSVKEIKDKKPFDLAIEHQYVIDKMMKKFNSIIPFNASTLVKEEEVKEWIDKEYEKIKKVLEKNRDKQEFGIQVFYNTLIKHELKNSVKEYISQQKKLREEIATKINQYKEEFYKQINELVDDIKVRKIKKSLDDKQLFLDISCLVHKNKVKSLKNKLKEINSMKEFSVCFNGPWAPYSFC